MKCPNCGGTGNIANGMWLCCECQGTGFIEDEKPSESMTNEEWFCSLSTENKAKEIYKMAKDDFKELRKLFYGVANDDCDAVALWLKQPHRGES